MILVVGATGVLGGLVTRRLLEQGHRVRVLVRPASPYQPLVEAGAEAVQGDLKDPASLTRACQGVEVVVTTANSAGRGGDDNVHTVDEVGNRSLIDAARGAGVRQLVFVSALGATDQSPVPFLRAKALTEQYLRESGVPFTILAPNLFLERWVPMLVGGPVEADQPVTLVGDGSRRHAMISVQDVAAFVVAAVKNPHALGRYLPLGGPAAITWRQVVEAAGQAVGHPISTRFVAPGDPIPGLPPMAWQMAAALETYDSPVDMEELARTFQVPLTSLEAYVARAFSPRDPE